MSKASVLRQKAEMFERRAETAADPLSKRHYREMAAEFGMPFYTRIDARRRPSRSRGCSDCSRPAAARHACSGTFWDRTIGAIAELGFSLDSILTGEFDAVVFFDQNNASTRHFCCFLL